MKIILSPAKKMRSDPDSFPVQSLPEFLDRTETLLGVLQSLSPEQLQEVWKCSDRIAEENIQRLSHMDLRKGLTPAILSYEGIAYQYMAPNVFTDAALAYVCEHLRILSGFYGVLRPTDGVTPYRLEMEAKLSVGNHRNLYGFWGDCLYRNVSADTDCIINLASKEYSKTITPYLTPADRMIQCVFAIPKKGKLVEQSTACKMARGQMVRFMAENQLQRPEDLREFTDLGYRYSREHSNQDTYVFIKEDNK